MKKVLFNLLTIVSIFLVIFPHVASATTHTCEIWGYSLVD